MRKIKNTQEGGLGTYLASGEHFFIPGSGVTEVDEKKLAEACKDPIFKGHFESGLLVDQTNDAKVEPAKPEPKKDDAKK